MPRFLFALVFALTFNGCSCSELPSPPDGGAPIDVDLEVDASPTLDAFVAADDAPDELDAHVEVDASAEDAAALPLDASCPDAGGPYYVDDAGLCPPGWEPTPLGVCITDYVPPEACR